MALLDRWNLMQPNPMMARWGGPHSQRINPQTGMPYSGPIPNPGNGPPGSEMPWGSDGSAFGALYGQQQPAQKPAGKPKQIGFGAPPPMMGGGMTLNGEAMVNSQDPSSLAYAPGTMSDNYQDMFGSPVERQPQPGDAAMGEDVANKAYDKNAKPDFWGQLSQGVEDFGYDNLGMMGLSLLTGAQRGGDWAPVLETFGGITRSKKEDKRYNDAQKRQAEQDAMQKQLFEQQLAEGKYTQEQRTRLGEQQQALAASLQQTNPDLANAIKSMSTEQFGQFYGNKLLADEQTKAEGIRLKAQQDFQRELTGMEIGARASEGAKDRAASLEAAKLRNPNETAQGRADLALLAPWQEAAGIAQTYTLRRVEKMKDIIQKLAKMNGLQGPIDANTKASLAGWGAASPEAAALYQEYRNLMGQFTREEAQKVKPVSNIDMDAIEKQMASPDMQLQASMNILDRIDREARAGIQRTNDMVRWHDSGKSFADVDPKTGKTIYETLGMTSSGLAGPAALPASNGSSAAPPAVGATMRGPDGKDYIYVGGDPNDKKNWQVKSSKSMPSATPFKNGYQSIRGG